MTNYNLSFYPVTKELTDIFIALEDNGGEVTPEIEQALAINEDNFAAKSVDFGNAILNFKAMAAAAKAEKERLAAIQKRYENAYNRLDKALTAAMDATGHDKVETPTMRLSLRHTTATEVDDLDQLPAEYKTTKVEVVADKTAIKKAIQSGEAVPGAHLVENVSLQIK